MGIHCNYFPLIPAQFLSSTLYFLCQKTSKRFCHTNETPTLAENPSDKIKIKYTVDLVFLAFKDKLEILINMFRLLITCQQNLHVDRSKHLKTKTNPGCGEDVCEVWLQSWLRGVLTQINFKQIKERMQTDKIRQGQHGAQQSHRQWSCSGMDARSHFLVPTSRMSSSHCVF